VLDLETRVHLHEEELSRLVVEDEFNRASALIANSQSRLPRLFPNVLPHALVEIGRRRFLENLLMSPLNTAISLTKRNAVTVLVCKHLNLNVSRRSDVLLHEHNIVTERAPCLALRTLQLLSELVRRLSNPHALTSSALDSLEQDRIANLLCLLSQDQRILFLAMITRNTRHTRRNHDLLAPALVSHVFDRFVRRANELDTRVLARFRKVRILAEETIARVDRFAAVLFRELDDPLAIEVLVRATEVYRKGRRERVLRVSVWVGVECCDADAGLGGCAVDSQGDLPAVGD